MEEQFESSWDKMLDKLSGWLEAVLLNLPNLIIAVIVFLVFYWLSRNLSSWVEKYLKKVIKQASIRDLLANILSIIILSLGLILAISVLNLDGVLKSLLAGAGVAGLAVGLALQGTLANTFSGIFLAIREILNVGDWVETNGFSGKVLEINLRHIKVKEPDNNIVVIPNKMVLENPFKNYGLTKRIRATITCGVAYDSDLRQVKEIAVQAISDLYPPNEGENIEFHYQEFGGSSIDFQLRFWVNATASLTALEAKSQAIMVLKEAFDENNIEIPFPIRTLVQAKTASEKE